MRTFEYICPRSLSDACRLLAGDAGHPRILAGGTDVLVELRKPNAPSPSMIMDISRLAELKGIEDSGDLIVIKPLTTHEEIARSEIIKRHAPLLQSAVSTIGSPQIRNRGTIGGNIMNAAACADTVPPLMALGAQLKLLSAEGVRILPMSEFFVKPYQTMAAQNELLTEIRFPKLPQNAKSTFVKLGRRNALAIARLSVAVVLVKKSDETISEARIVPGAVFPQWQRVPEAEHVLVGKKPSIELFAEAGEKVSETMIALTGRRWSTEYKEPVIAVLVRRALEGCS
jgi:CO/xanthine dehydrogenase FAD-binding subunit